MDYIRLNKFIRDLCLFSRHDITTDPPFAKLNLISCRNLLIYFTADLQKHVVPIFHYALVPNGLSVARAFGNYRRICEAVFHRGQVNQVYRRRDAPLAVRLQFPASTYVPGKQDIDRKVSVFTKPVLDINKLPDLILQSEYPGVLINEETEILQFRGRTAPFIEPAAGVRQLPSV